MLTLPQNVLTEDTSAINGSSYNPTQLSAGIVYIGLGSRMPVHPVYYTGKFLNLSNQSAWGIRVIDLLPAATSEKQSFPDESRAVIDVIAAHADPKKTVACLADPAINIIALALTEDDYKLAAQDVANAGQSLMVFDFLTEALARRRDQASGPLTILSCDDVARNGDVAKNALLSFVKAKDAHLADWIDRYVTFPNSVADAVAPTSTAEQSVTSEYSNRITEYWEELADWIIEDNFSAGRPDWEIAGAMFVGDSTPYEVLKQRFQNASYSLLAYPAFLAGYRTVHEAMNDSVFSNYVTIFINRLVSPQVTVPENVDLTEYKDKLVGRLSNDAINRPLAQVCADGASKLPSFVLPTLTGLIEQEKPTYCLAFLLAAYGHYLWAATDDMGEAYPIDEPHLSKGDWCKIKDPDVLAFLDSSPFASAQLAANDTPFCGSLQAISQADSHLRRCVHASADNVYVFRTPLNRCFSPMFADRKQKNAELSGEHR